MQPWHPEPGDMLVHPEAMTARQLYELVEASDAGATRKRDLKSAVRCIARVLGRSLDALPIDPEYLKPKLDAVIPKAHGLANSTWGKRLSEFGQTMKLAGIGCKLRPIEMSGVWEDMRIKMRAHGDRSIICWLGQFLRFGFMSGINPADVTFETVLAYEAERRAAAPNRDAGKTAYYAARMWDKAADTIPGWPQNRVGWKDRRGIYCLPWSALPPSLEADVEAWLSRSDGADIFDDWDPGARRKPVTREKRRYELQRFASALVHAGIEPESLTTIAALLEMDTLRRGLRWLRDERFGGELTGGLQNIVIALASAARWHLRVDAAHQARLDDIVKQCARTEPGMTLKNQLRMEPFKNPDLVRKHLDLPEQLFARLRGHHNARRAAASAETALAIAMLTWCPLRIGNLRAIEIDRHMKRERRGRTARVYLVIPSGEVKNSIDLKFELPPQIATLLDRFIAEHRTQLAQPGSRFLFSRRSGDAPIDYSSLAGRIKKTLRTELGVDFSTHNFRHLAGLIWLLENPTGYEVVRRLLGHKAASTAMDFYVGLQTDAAHKAFTGLLAGYRERRNA